MHFVTTAHFLEVVLRIFLEERSATFAAPLSSEATNTNYRHRHT
jgi:hypothetical protein